MSPFQLHSVQFLFFFLEHNIDMTGGDEDDWDRLHDFHIIFNLIIVTYFLRIQQDKYWYTNNFNFSMIQWIKKTSMIDI